MNSTISSSAESADKEVVILGAGLAGLSAGWILAKRGYTVTLLEKTGHCGGLAVTKRREDCAYDLGPHNIHTPYRHVLEIIRSRVDGMFEHSPTFKVFKRGRFIQYPIVGKRVLTALPWHQVIPAAVGFVLAHVRQYLGLTRQDASFLDWIVNRFGRRIYLEYFKTYPEKVWGLPTDEIDRYVAEERVPAIGLLDLIKSAVGRQSSMTHREFSQKNYYIADGIGEVPRFLEREFTQSGGTILTHVELQKILVEQSRIKSVKFRREGGEARTIEPAFLLSTIPVDQMIDLVAGLPQEIDLAGKELSYRSGVLLYLLVNQRDPLPAHSIYFTGSTFPISRVTDLAKYSAKMVPDGKSLLCFELPCQENDAIWIRSIDELKQIALESLEDTGVLEGVEVERVFRENLTHFYPQFRFGYRERLTSVFGYLGELENCLSYGRQGGFAYVNTDQVTHMGIAAANAVITQEAVGGRCKTWFGMSVDSAYSLES
jgi:protoporphyrinogen oxidase